MPCIRKYRMQSPLFIRIFGISGRKVDVILFAFSTIKKKRSTLKKLTAKNYCRMIYIVDEGVC